MDFTELPPDVRTFRPRCPGCTPATVTGADARPCSFYDCPGLPEGLKVTCDTCMYDFVAGDGQIKCDHTECETALALAANADVYRTWLRMIEATTA